MFTGFLRVLQHSLRLGWACVLFFHMRDLPACMCVCLDFLNCSVCPVPLRYVTLSFFTDFIILTPVSIILVFILLLC